jgi:hypothetical protein
MALMAKYLSKQSSHTANQTTANIIKKTIKHWAHEYTRQMLNAFESSVMLCRTDRSLVLVFQALCLEIWRYCRVWRALTERQLLV